MLRDRFFQGEKLAFQSFSAPSLRFRFAMKWNKILKSGDSEKIQNQCNLSTVNIHAEMTKESRRCVQNHRK